MHQRDDIKQWIEMQLYPLIVKLEATGVESPYFDPCYSWTACNVHIQLSHTHAYKYLVGIDVSRSSTPITRDIRWEHLRFEVECTPEMRFNPKLFCEEILKQFQLAIIGVPDTDLAQILFGEENT